MNKHFFTVFILVVLTANHVHAQFTFGVRTGLNYTSIWGGVGEPTGSTAVPPGYQIGEPPDYPANPANNKLLIESGILGYQIGAVADYSINDKFSIESGLLLSKKGFKNQTFGMGQNGKELTFNVSEKTNYIQIPVHVCYKLGNRFLVHAGPYFGFAISGKRTSDISLDGEKMYERNLMINFGRDKFSYGARYCRIFDWGLGTGLAVRLGNIQVGLEGNTGLISINRDEIVSFDDMSEHKANTHNKNGCLSLTATYMFGK